MPTTRRRFLSTTIGGGLAMGGAWEFLSRLRPVGAAEAALAPSLVTLDSGVEPTVRLLEETPREKLMEEVADRVKKGLSYRELLAGLLLAGVRNVQPRPAVGFKFHAVLVINSAHLASLASPAQDRWLPIFWALDRFKAAQVETQKANGWRMSGVDEARVPPASKAREEFIRAMEAWDESAADAAAAALARHVGRNEVFELFARFGARDFRDIGHKAIFVANSFRTLECIGWQHAEPVLRSLAYALLKFDGENPAQSDAAPDKAWRHNLELAKKVRADWQDAKAGVDASGHLLAALRAGTDEEASAAVVEALNDGASPASIFDALGIASQELLMRKTGIVTLHSVTSSNALRFTYDTAADPRTRLMLLLQNAAFVASFRAAAGKLPEGKLDQLESMPTQAREEGDAVAEIFATASHDRPAAARKALGYLNQTQRPDALMHQARRLVFLKGNDAHDYKFSSAVLEDFSRIAPAWRNRYLAAAMFYLPGSEGADNALVKRVRAAME